MKLIHAIVDAIYYASARMMPMRIDDWTGGTWAGTYVMRSRFYFEVKDHVAGPHWPWHWGDLL
jgi:hypothetical protein